MYTSAASASALSCCGSTSIRVQRQCPAAPPPWSLAGSQTGAGRYRGSPTSAPTGRCIRFSSNPRSAAARCRPTSRSARRIASCGVNGSADWNARVLANCATRAAEAAWICWYAADSVRPCAQAFRSRYVSSASSRDTGRPCRFSRSRWAVMAAGSAAAGRCNSRVPRCENGTPAAGSDGWYAACHPSPKSNSHSVPASPLRAPLHVGTPSCSWAAGRVQGRSVTCSGSCPSLGGSGTFSSTRRT